MPTASAKQGGIISIANTNASTNVFFVKSHNSKSERLKKDREGYLTLCICADSWALLSAMDACLSENYFWWRGSAKSSIIGWSLMTTN